MVRNLYSFTEWMAINRVFFRHLSLSNCLDSKMREHHICTEALISRVISSMFPCIFQALWTWYYIIRLPMRKQAAGVCLTELSAILFLPSLVGILVEMILPQGVASWLLASEIPVFWPKLLLSKVGKKIVRIFRQLLGHTVSGLSERQRSFCQQSPVSRFILSMCPWNIQEYSRQT